MTITYHKTVTKHIINFKLFQLSVELMSNSASKNLLLQIYLLMMRIGSFTWCDFNSKLLTFLLSEVQLSTNFDLASSKLAWYTDKLLTVTSASRICPFLNSVSRKLVNNQSRNARVHFFIHKKLWFVLPTTIYYGETEVAKTTKLILHRNKIVKCW